MKCGYCGREYDQVLPQTCDGCGASFDEVVSSVAVNNLDEKANKVLEAFQRKIAVDFLSNFGISVPLNSISRGSNEFFGWIDTDNFHVRYWYGYYNVSVYFSSTTKKLFGDKVEYFTGEVQVKDALDLKRALKKYATKPEQGRVYKEYPYTLY